MKSTCDRVVPYYGWVSGLEAAMCLCRNHWATLKLL